MTPKLVIFDCDGVLVDTETTTARIIAHSLGSYGLQIDPTEVHDLFQGGTMMGAAQEALRRGAHLPSTWVADVNAQVIEAFANGAPVFDGVHHLLERLEAHNIPTAVASNGPMDKMRATLGPSGLWSRFEGRIYSGRLSGPKPAPDMLLAACTQAQVAPNQAVMIDDTPIGTAAADAAGMPAIGFAAASDVKRLRATGHPVVQSMNEIIELLRL